jgi:hypothetical protein
MSIWADMSTIVTATLSGDINFKVVQAYRSDGAWFVFGPLTIIGAVLVHFIYKAVPWLDRNLERSIVVYAYIFKSGALVNDDPSAAVYDYGVVRMFV